MASHNMNEPIRNKWRTWLPTIVLAMFLTYLLSFGPACWIASRSSGSASIVFVDSLFTPMVWLCRNSPTTVARCFERYANLCCRDNTTVEISNGGIDFWDEIGKPIIASSFQTTISCSYADENTIAVKVKSDAESP